MEPRARLVLATFLVTLGVGVGTGWAVGRTTLASRPVSPERPAPVPQPAPARAEPELSPTLKRLLADLTSADAATWREAAVRLAFTRPFPSAALGALDAPDHRARVLTVLDGALSQCLPLEEVLQVPALGRLLAPALTTARRQLDNGLLARFDDLKGAHDAPDAGVAIAVALQALRSSDPRQVLQGLHALERVKPACAKERVRSLLANGTMVVAGTARVRVSEAADAALRALPSRTTPLAGLEELLRDTPLFETVREVEPAAAKAESVDAWFERARPVWRAWWTLSQAGPPSDEVWRARTNEFLHFAETRRLHPRGRSLLHVTGAPPVRCQLATTEGVVANAALPIEYEGDAPDDAIHLACHHPANEKLIDQTFRFEAGDELTIEVLAP